MTATGEDVRAARETLNMSRKQLGEQLGLTVSQVARIETRGPREDEVELFTDLLQKAGVTTEPPPEDEVNRLLDEVHGELPDPPASAEGDATGFDNGVIVSEEWRGLRRGQVVRVDGEIGQRFRFGYHYLSDTQEYVGVYSVKNGNERCIRPERIRDQRGKVPRA